MGNFLDSTGLSHLIKKIKDTFVMKADVDSTPTANSTKLITSGGVYNAIGNIETLLAAI